MKFWPPETRPRRRLAKAAAATAMLTAAGSILVVGAPSASAAPAAMTITVTTLDASLAASPGDATSCVDAATGDCSLQAALDQANAQPANTGAINIVFGSALSGYITTTGATPKMSTTGGSDYQAGGYAGADFVVDARSGNSITVDFGNRVGFQSIDDAAYNGMDIRSDNTTIENFTQAESAESTFLVRGVSGTTIRNGSIKQYVTSGGASTWNMEVGVELLDGTTNTTLSHLTLFDPWQAGVAVNSTSTVTGTTIDHVTMTNRVNAPYFVWLGANATVKDTAMSNASVTVPTGAPYTGYVVYLDGGEKTNGFTIDASTFTGMRGGVVGTAGNEPTNNFAVTNSVFDGVGEVFDDGGGAQANMTWTGNTFKNGTAAGPYYPGVFHMDSGVYTNLSISDNDFTDNTATGIADIYFSWPGGSNNVIANNTFTRTATYQFQEAIRSDVVASSATADTGWSITGNHIDGYGSAGNALAPINIAGRGKLPVTKNTFGPNTNGTTNNSQAEGGALWFVGNRGGGANSNLQTWRPANPVFDGTDVTFDVAPVSPVVGGDAVNQPTTPVDLDVYWTADDNAEVYLGRISGVSSAGTVSIPTTKTTGFIRVQTVDATGATSQYSGLAAPTPVAAPVITGPTGGTQAGNTVISGTGIAGATVTVTDSGSPVCTATVAPDGTWSCTPSVALTSGAHTLVATQQLAPGGQVSDPSNTVTFTSDGTPMFASGWVVLATLLLLVAGGALWFTRRRRGTAAV